MFYLLQLLYIFSIGAVFGSFLNVIVDRLPKGQSVIKGRSYCDSCGKTIPWYDLIPVLSYLLLRGKCRNCKKSISFYYPLVEITSGVLFALSFVRSPDLVGFLFLLFIISTLLVIFFADLKYGIIPFFAVFPGVLIVLLYTAIIEPSAVITAILSAIGAGMFFLIIFLLTKGRGMGFGDVVYVFYMGLLLGYPGILVGLYLGFLTGAGVSLILILAGKKRLRGDTIPFGPFLVFGTVSVLFFGPEMLSLIRQYVPIL